MLVIKEHLYTYCKDYLQTKITTVQKGIQEAQTAANQETKSSAGDKYETGRAMMQLEKEKYTRQLAELLKLKKVLDQMGTPKVHSESILGSLVTTNQGNYYLSISVGKILLEEQIYFAISPASPLGRLLLGKKLGEQFSFRNQAFSILAIV